MKALKAAQLIAGLGTLIFLGGLAQAKLIIGQSPGLYPPVWISVWIFSPFLMGLIFFFKKWIRPAKCYVFSAAVTTISLGILSALNFDQEDALVTLALYAAMAPALFFTMMIMAMFLPRRFFPADE